MTQSIPVDNHHQHHIQPLKSHKDFQKSYHMQDEEDGLNAVQDCSHTLHLVFYQLEVWQEQLQVVVLQFKYIKQV